MFVSKFARPARIAAASMILTLAAATAWPANMYALLLGSVSVSTATTSPIVVMVVNRRTGKVAQRAFLETKRAFRLPLVPGNYRFYAFADTNRNGLRDADEAVSVAYTLSTPLRAGEMIELPALDIR
ncbi:MAG: hypothetical protein ABI821_14020 [Pseudomonadota bacterium]